MRKERDMGRKLLDRIGSPEDLRKLGYPQLEILCGEIRTFLIENVSKTGGHLSSNLGVVELTVTLHRSFRSPQDVILFDVGHQSYTHKLLTGRRKGFEHLRNTNGNSGFPVPSESPHDAMHAGHGSAALSAAIGLAQAKKMKNEPGSVVVVIGDGAFTGGMIYEGVNNLGALDNLIIVLNDNAMSISKNVGALAQYLTQLRGSPGYTQAKRDVKAVLDSTPVIGSSMVKGIQSMKSVLRKGLYKSTFFEEMGLRYIGPADGHDIPALYGLFSGAKQCDGPVMIHVETVKGKGYIPAEKNPGAFHGVSASTPDKIPDPDISTTDSFSNVFGRKLAQLAGQDRTICAITAAMKYGTGLQYFKKAHRNRFFDVGMAEEHAVTFAGGLAAGGMRPVVAIYSTFLQRAYDQIIHDVVLGNRDVLFAIDRAGLVEGDGETHQGIYDVAMLSQQPDLPIVSPCNYAELEFWLEKLMQDHRGPKALRYARGAEPEKLADKPCSGALYDCLEKSDANKLAIVSYGTEIAQAMAAHKALKAEGHAADLYQLVMINPIPADLLQALTAYDAVLFAEEGMASGGIGEHLASKLMASDFKGTYRHIAVQTPHVTHANLPYLRKQASLDAAGIARAATLLLEKL